MTIWKVPRFVLKALPLEDRGDLNSQSQGSVSFQEAVSKPACPPPFLAYV